MASLEEKVRGLCELTDKVLIDPSKSPKEIAVLMGASFLLGPSGSIAVLVIKTWFNKKEREREEKERMLREIIRKQQAVINRLEAELAKERQRNANNRKEIKNLKEMLRMLEEAERQLKAA